MSASTSVLLMASSIGIVVTYPYYYYIGYYELC